MTDQTDQTDQKAEATKRAGIAAPGGSAMPAMNYKNRERGTGTGKAIEGTSANGETVKRKRSTDTELYGTGLLGESMAPQRASMLAQKFQVPPFTVLNAREGFWQDRKRAWLALGIKSELGRGETFDYESSTPATVAPKASVTAEVPKIETDNAPAKLITKPKPRSAAPVQSKKRFALPTVEIEGQVRKSGIEAPKAKPKLPLPEPSLIAQARSANLDFDKYTWDEQSGGAVALDIEVFENFFLICMERLLSNNTQGKRIAFEMSDRSDIDWDKLTLILEKECLVTFRGAMYDIPLIVMALKGAKCADLKLASDRIILGGLKPWQVAKELGINIPNWNHIDLSEPNPSVRMSLKVLSGRMHCRYLMDLPYPPETYLSPQQMNVATLYCFNDLDHTKQLWFSLKEPIMLRYALTKKYGVDMRSKSDAQVGEETIRKLIEQKTKKRIPYKTEPKEMRFTYTVPSFISFSTEPLKNLLAKLSESEFYADPGGNVTPPQFLRTDNKISIGSSVYTMGIGGLHSNESCRALHSDDENQLWDADVSGQYPEIIIKLGMYPPGAGKIFTDIYASMQAQRLSNKQALKSDKDNKELLASVEGDKIALNGVFGKTLSSYSFLYCPPLGIGTTLTGQLSVLMLAERAELAGIPVVSGNTDGVLFNCPRKRESVLDEMLQQWEAETGFTVERTKYKSIYNRDVNCYMAIKEDGKAKRKGGNVVNAWGDKDQRGILSTNRQMSVCSDAVLKFITDKVPFEDFIHAANDIRDFVTIQRVNGGAEWRGTKLGRVVRFYWSEDCDSIIYVGSGKRVPKTDRARPIMELTDAMPSDLDRARYVEEAVKIAVEIAAIKKDELV